MKAINKITIFALILVLSVTSCKKNLLREELNESPSSLLYPEPSVILPSVIGNSVYLYGGDFARMSGIFTQQLVGSGNQWAGFNNYNFTDANFTNAWEAMYSTTLNNTKNMMDYAEENDMHHYNGVGKILSGFTYSVLVDYWNDVPQSEALLAPDILQPAYDRGASVYTAAHAMLDEGISLLGQADPGVVPGSNDLLFAGDVTKWIEFAHAIKARMYLHTKDYTNCKTELAAANGVDASMSFTSNSGPMSQFNTNRAGDITYMGSYMYTELTNINDMRAYAYVDTADNDLGSLYSSPTAPVSLISAMEQKYMEAELAARAGDASATTLLEDADLISYANTNVNSLTDLNAAYPYNAADPEAQRIETVMMHKYFAMFMQPESFADWRRTGVPNIAPLTGANIPRRYLYIPEEKNTNPNTPAGVTIYQRVFWDN